MSYLKVCDDVSFAYFDYKCLSFVLMDKEYLRGEAMSNITDNDFLNKLMIVLWSHLITSKGSFILQVNYQKVQINH